MDKIPFEERRVIDELVELWKTRYEPRDLVTHIDRLSGTWGSGIGASFFQQMYQDLHADKRSKYAAISASDFKRFIEAEYSKLAQTHAERQAQAQAKANAERQAQAKADAERRARVKADAEHQAQVKAKEHEEHERRARADFDALGKEMAKATTRAELVELGRKRADLAPYTGVSYDYTSHCWKCKKHISSAIHAQCSGCQYYICSSCSSCLCGSLNY